jgi:hypothetical protein
LADALGLAVESVDELAEGHGADAVRLVQRMAGESAVLCTHGDVASSLLDLLLPDGTAKARASLRLQKGEVWVVQSTESSVTIVDHLRRIAGGAAKSTEGE